jgi:hypothetical protein
MARSSILVSVSSDLAARRVPFIYAGFAGSCRALYLGETRSSTGVLGRISQHISETPSNTFRQRICAILRCDEVVLDDVHFVAVPLSSYKGFWLDSPEYRRAVEYLVQLQLLNMIADAKVRVTLMSRVNGNGYTTQKNVQNEAKQVAERLFAELTKIF